MEIRLRYLLPAPLLLLILALVALGPARRGHTVVPPATGVPSVAPTRVVVRPSSDRPIAFADASALWDWQVACQEPLALWLQQIPISFRTLRITLVDQSESSPTTVGIAYPEINQAAARVRAACSGQEEQTCQVWIYQGTVGPDLDVAVTAVIPYAIRHAWRVRTPGGGDQVDADRLHWTWDQFQPLLRKEGNTWRSSCLTVFKP